MRHWCICVLLLLQVFGLHAQTDTLGSVLLMPKTRPIDRFTSTRAYQMTYIGVPLVVASLIVKRGDDHFRSLRQSYAPSFRYHYDDYLQYAPAGLMLGLKAGGVRSRSSWGRMLVSDAFSVALMAGLVNPIKSIAKVRRPDGSANNSFPSGHTATAFMTATMLHKEYGWRSPWYSVAGYSIATVTGVSRMLNNRHWLSDVLAGAGIGILATEFGYFFADLIYKDRGFTGDKLIEVFDPDWRPSFLGFNIGLDVVPGRYNPSPTMSMEFLTGASMSVEGAYFFSRYFGVGGETSIVSHSFTLNDLPQTESLRSIAGYAGAYFSVPISVRWIAGAKAFAGYYFHEHCEGEGYRFGERGGLSGGAGCSLMYRAKQNMGVRFYVNYKAAPPIVKSGEVLHKITLGSSINIVF